MKHSPAVQKIDSAILFGMEICSSLSVVLLSIGVIASMSNTLTNGWLLGQNIAISRGWIMSQTLAMDTGLVTSIVRSFVMAKQKHYLQMSLYVILSALLLSTTAIVSNIESLQQTLGISLVQAYAYSPIPLTWLVSMRSLSVVLLIVAHALKYVDADGLRDTDVPKLQVQAQENVGKDIDVSREAEQPTQAVQPMYDLEAEDNGEGVTVTEDKLVQPQLVQPDIVQQLPAPKTERGQQRRTDNADTLARVQAYMLEHPSATARTAGSDLDISSSTANKYMRQIKESQLQ